MNRSGPFFSAYKAANASFSAETFRCAEETVEALLSTSTDSLHPGMLLGKVQSGKTRTFISVLAAAFDNGYDIAIVLSKNSKALIQQTYKRLGSEFNMFVDDGELEIYDIMSAPKSFSKFELDSKLIIVSKKQDDNLRRLIDLFRRNELMANKRTLIIDDEADSASIGYSRKGDVIEANKIATQVHQLRSVTKQLSFLQVTATPYSLYLQPTSIEVDNVLDFQPLRPAFTKLVPVPEEYVGGETYFGERSQGEFDSLESLIHVAVDHAEFDRLKKQDQRIFKLRDVLTTEKLDGYRSAIVTFIVGGCLQRINGERAGMKAKRLRYSFLLHSEAGKEAHEWQERLTEEIVTQLGQQSRANSELFRELVGRSYADLSRSLTLASLPVPTLDDVRDGVSNALSRDEITIVKVNSEDNVADKLDDSGQLKLRTPLNIFLGGQVLDRGVTLANLIGFYYGRRPNKFQQDTVLQHSRMYGYRRPDLAVTRFYTSRAIRQAMAQMEEFDSALRTAIETGGDKSVQFIRVAPNGSIVPCSPNKILVSTTQTLRPHKRILPIGFQSLYKTGENGIGKAIDQIDSDLKAIIDFNADKPVLVPLNRVADVLRKIEGTLVFPDDDAPGFDWNAMHGALVHLCAQHPDPNERGKVWVWTADGRNSSRLAGQSSHAKYIETPDSEKTEGQLAKRHAIDHPIVFLLRQEGSEAKGWRGTPFYWPVVRAQAHARTSIFASEMIE